MLFYFVQIPIEGWVVVVVGEGESCMQYNYDLVASVLFHYSNPMLACGSSVLHGVCTYNYSDLDL